MRAMLYFERRKRMLRGEYGRLLPVSDEAGV
jgi:hypothetical protein